MAAADVEGHRGLDEVPRVGVAARDPRDVAVGLLDRRDRVDGLRDLRAREDAGDLGELRSVKAALSPFRHRGGHLLAVDDEALAEHRVQRAVGARAQRGLCSIRWHEEVVVALAPAHASVLSSPYAHFSHQYGEWSACAWCEPRRQQPGALELLLELVLAVDADVPAGRVVVVGS